MRECLESSEHLDKLCRSTKDNVGHYSFLLKKLKLKKKKIKATEKWWQRKKLKSSLTKDKKMLQTKDFSGLK